MQLFLKITLGVAAGMLIVFAALAVLSLFVNPF